MLCKHHCSEQHKLLGNPILNEELESILHKRIISVCFLYLSYMYILDHHTIIISSKTSF